MERIRLILSSDQQVLPMSAIEDEISPAQQFEHVQAYLRRDLHRVHGYLKRLDADLIASLAAWQTRRHIVGGLVEIGVHHGKLFFVLALSRHQDERALAIDLFEDDSLNRGGPMAGRAQAFRRNAERLKIRLGDRETLKADSLTLVARDIVERVDRVRLFSVDGGHLYRHVENDLALALDTLLPEGVVAVDDFCNAAWPEVTFATYDFLRTHKSELAPVIATRHKVYLAHPTMSQAYAQHAEEFARSQRNAKLTSIEMIGWMVPCLTSNITSRVLDEVRSQLSLYLTLAPA